MNRIKKLNLFSITLAAAIWSVGVPASAGVEAKTVETAPDDTWISVSGKVVRAGPDSFRLDYGEGLITVEMDDFDFYKEGRNLMVNDDVVVYGVVDDDLFEKRTIEASSVFVENLGTHFYASAADEEGAALWTVSFPVLTGRAELTGRVEGVKGRMLTLDTGRRDVRVDTSLLGFDPTDDEGFLKIEAGDRIKVEGRLNGPLLTEGELDATWIVELSD